jgi:hypothetical protein
LQARTKLAAVRGRAPGVVRLQDAFNYLNRQVVADVISALRLTGSPVRSMNAFKGEVPGFHVYHSPAGLLARTADAVKELLARGFAIGDIVVLTCRGRLKSAVLAAREIGSFAVRQFTGAYGRFR